MPHPPLSAKMIGIERVAHLPHRPLYVLIAGGIAAGKNHVVHQHLPTIPVMDVDHVMEANGWTDYDGDEYKQAMAIIRERIEERMAARQSLIAMGTAANLPFTVDRLHNAKLLGYTTVLLHVDAPEHQALAQNEERRLKGKRAVPNHLKYRILETYRDSRRTVELLRDTVLVDFHVHHVNVRMPSLVPVS